MGGVKDTWGSLRVVKCERNIRLSGKCEKIYMWYEGCEESISAIWEQ